MTTERSFPRGLPQHSKIAPTATALWHDPATLEKDAASNGEFAYQPGRIWLGRSTAGRGVPVGWKDDKHMVTIAGSRSGKGVSAIIPVLCDYPGSVICIDPKGENAFHTTARRGFGTSSIEGLHQDVYVLDPYGISGVARDYLATFNPLAELSPESDDALEEAGLIAEALVVSSESRDAHWDDTARNLIEALILHVVSWPYFDGIRTLGQVQRLLRDGDTEEYQLFKESVAEDDDPTLKNGIGGWTAFDSLLAAMETNEAFSGVISGAALAIKSMGNNERGSVLSTARRNMKFLDAPRMQACLGTSAHALQLEDLKREPHGVSVYLVLPARFMKTHSRWMRLILNLTVSRLERDPKPPAKDHAVLAILDEFATLGHMPVLESAVGYMAGFGLKLWAVLQDLPQLKRHYPASWETFLGNAGLLQVFGNSDQTTLDYISKRLGELEVIREVMNRNETITATVSDMSDFDKAKRTEGRGVIGGMTAGFGLANATTSRSEAKATSDNKTQNIQKTALMTPDEIRLHFASERGKIGLQIIAISGHHPIFLWRSLYYEDSFFKGKFRSR